MRNSRSKTWGAGLFATLQRHEALRSDALKRLESSMRLYCVGDTEVNSPAQHKSECSCLLDDYFQAVDADPVPRPTAAAVEKNKKAALASKYLESVEAIVCGEMPGGRATAQALMAELFDEIQNLAPPKIDPPATAATNE